MHLARLIYKPQATLVLDPDVSDWAYVRVPAAGGSLSLAEIVAVNTLVLGLKAASLWGKIYRMNLFVGTWPGAVLCPLVITEGAAVDTAYNFVSGDYDRQHGLSGDGLDKYLDTGLHPADSLDASSHHLSGWVRTNALTSGCILHAQEGADIYIGLHGEYHPELHSFFASLSLFDGTGRIAADVSPGEVGWYCGSRTASDYAALYYNGSTTPLGTLTGSLEGSLPDQPLFVFAEDQSGTPFTFSGDQLLMYSAGSGLSDTEMHDFYDLLSAFNTALSRV